MRPFFFASSKAVRRTFSGCASSGWMIASSSWSIAGPAAAPVSAFTLKPLSVHGLWLAVLTIPAFAFRRIVAQENDCVGAAAVARGAYAWYAGTISAAAADIRPEANRRP